MPRTRELIEWRFCESLHHRCHLSSSVDKYKKFVVSIKLNLHHIFHDEVAEASPVQKGGGRLLSSSMRSIRWWRTPMQTLSSPFYRQIRGTVWIFSASSLKRNAG
ncbi:hypothetical protein PC114_g25038 [Phytophthora cactorum]|nr:hypothetical protein PC114_g25038 [Phytophthora cactorum]